MRLKTKFEQFVKSTKDDFRSVSLDMTSVFRQLRSLEVSQNDFLDLRNEIATNGVVRDLKEAHRTIKQLLSDNDALHARFAELEQNGVATAINKLNKEVFGERKNSGSNLERVLLHMNGVEQSQEATLAGKVDAIIEHLGIDVTVEPEKTTPAKIVTKKVKSQKKGKR